MMLEFQDSLQDAQAVASTWPYCGSLVATNALLLMLKPGGSGASKAGLAESLGGLSPWSFVIWL